jgi:signal transduction histidine kinase/CheY-like chemotaxis protein
MQRPLPVPNEAGRLAALKSLEVLDTPPDPVLDELTRVASRICRTPIALVSLVDESRQWFKARVGLGATETPRDVAFCAHAIHGTDLFVVPDSHVDERFRDNPLVTGAPHVRFYAGAPLVVDGHGIGTLCVIDHVPRQLDGDDREALRALGRAVAGHVATLRTQRELSSARAEAERIAHARAQFLATMSHEIRTPMNGVLGSLELLSEQPLNGDAAELAAIARDSGRRLMGLLDDVLDLSKLDAGAVELERRPFDLQAELGAVVALMRPVAVRKGVALGSAPMPTMPHYVGDAARIRQIATNLVANALKFTGRGEVWLSAAVRARYPVEHELEITVRDTGIGMSADVLEHLFTPFRQADASTARRYGGTGLGLAISRDLAVLMGGTLEATSVPGQGSCFTLRLKLPLASAPASHVAPRSAPDRACAPPHEALDCHVLLVDDESVNRLIVDRVLKKAGCRVTQAVDGLEALARASEQRFDVILMDCMMPRLDGLEATRRLRRERGPNSGTPVLALTANVMQEEHAACRAAGMDDVLTKPLLPARLRAALARQLQARLSDVEA